jgi:hypothetical protein
MFYASSYSYLSLISSICYPLNSIFLTTQGLTPLPAVISGHATKPSSPKAPFDHHIPPSATPTQSHTHLHSLQTVSLLTIYILLPLHICSPQANLWSNGGMRISLVTRSSFDSCQGQPDGCIPTPPRLQRQDGHSYLQRTD